MSLWSKLFPSTQATAPKQSASIPDVVKPVAQSSRLVALQKKIVYFESCYTKAKDEGKLNDIVVYNTIAETLRTVYDDLNKS